MVLVRSDEDHWALSWRDLAREPIAIIQVSRDPKIEHLDHPVDGAGRPRPTENHRVLLLVGTHRRADDLTGLLAEVAGLQAGAGRLGVSVGVKRQHHVADEVLDEAQGPSRGGVIRVRDPAGSVRPRDGFVLADYRRADDINKVHLSP